MVQSVLRGHCESCAGPTEAPCEFSVSHQRFLHTHPQPRYAYMLTMPTFFSLKLPACFLFLFFSRSTSHDYNSCPPNTAGEAISVKWETEKDLNWKMFGRQLNGRVTC